MSKLTDGEIAKIYRDLTDHDTVEDYRWEMTREKDRFRYVNPDSLDAPKSLEEVKITKGMANAMADNPTGNHCPTCDMKMPKYVGRYPKDCPDCKMELMPPAPANAPPMVTHLPPSMGEWENEKKGGTGKFTKKTRPDDIAKKRKKKAFAKKFKSFKKKSIESLEYELDNILDIMGK